GRLDRGRACLIESGPREPAAGNDPADQHLLPGDGLEGRGERERRLGRSGDHRADPERSEDPTSPNLVARVLATCPQNGLPEFAVALVDETPKLRHEPALLPNDAGGTEERLGT